MKSSSIILCRYIKLPALNSVTGDPYETDVPAVSYSGPGVTATFVSNPYN